MLFKNRIVKKYLYKQFIELQEMRKLSKSIGAHSGLPMSKALNEINIQQKGITEQILKLSEHKKRKSYNFKLGRKKIIGKVYAWYFRLFNGFEYGSGPVTIIGKVNKHGKCEYPNTPFYRLTKAWKWV